MQHRHPRKTHVLLSTEEQYYFYGIAEIVPSNWHNIHTPWNKCNLIKDRHVMISDRMNYLMPHILSLKCQAGFRLLSSLLPSLKTHTTRKVIYIPGYLAVLCRVPCSSSRITRWTALYFNHVWTKQFWEHYEHTDTFRVEQSFSIVFQCLFHLFSWETSSSFIICPLDVHLMILVMTSPFLTARTTVFMYKHSV